MFTNLNFQKFRIYFLSIAISILLLSRLNAQYTFMATSGTYTPLTGGVALDAIETDDNLSSYVNLGFTFKYNGKNYTKTRISSNGFISFKTSSPISILRSLKDDSTCIVALGGDLSGDAGAASYKTEGIAPNRVFTVEWLNWKWNFLATQAGISFQLKLYETSNRIEFIYRQEPGALNNASAQIGLSLQQPGKYIGLTNSGSNPSTSSINDTYISTKPANGQIYRFDELISPKADTHVSNFGSLLPGSISLKWTDATGTNLPTRYLVKVSNVSFDDIIAPVDGVEITPDRDLKDGKGEVYVNHGDQKFRNWLDSAGNTTYYMKIFPVSNYFTNTRYKTDGTVPQIQVSLPFYFAKNLSFTNVNSTSITLNWLRGSGTNCIVFAKGNEAAGGIASPVNNTTYTANAVFGSGTQIGSTGWYCVYNGPASTVTVTGLQKQTPYGFHVIEYTGAAGAEQYKTEDEPTGHKSQITNLFSDIGGTFTGITFGAALWCDYDNDGDLDFITAGETSTARETNLYNNTGSNTFVKSTVTFPQVSYASASWGDYDNDGYSDLLLTGAESSQKISKIYHNNTDGTFSELTTVTLPGYHAGNALWGDYNNDGFSDIFICGSDGTNYFSKVFLNTGKNSFIEQTKISLDGIDYSSSLWVDLDNDNDLDLLISGYIKTNYISKIYRNDDNGTFTELTGINIPQFANSAHDAGDYDSDGDLDLLFTGNIYNNSTSYSKVYRNDGNFTFSEQTSIVLSPVKNGSSKWGDYDNDGDLDILLSGIGSRAKIYKNTAGVFAEDPTITLPTVEYSCVAWGDYDADKDLDLLITGKSPSGFITKVFRNDISTPNTLPAAPTGLSSTFNNGVILQWNAVTGDATPANGLTYNVRVGNATEEININAPMSSITGLRRVAAMGNAQTGTTFKLQRLTKGTYYWSVQAVDNSFGGGPFSAEQTFVYNIEHQASGLNLSEITPSSIKCSWLRGNGEKCVVFAKETTSGTAAPENNTIYTANSIFGSGTQVSSTGWFCVYNGTSNEVTVTGLKAHTTYTFQVIEYTGGAGSEAYFTSTSPTGQASERTILFSDQDAIVLNDLTNGSLAWADYDNDGDLDVLVTGTDGTVVSELYRNNGDNTFTNQTAISLTGVYDSSVAWCDYDKDGDLDILLTGSTGSAPVSKIYRNNGNNTFSEQTSIQLTGVYNGSVAWADYDKDGNPDILLTGHNGTSYVSKIYRNGGNNTFTEQTGISIPGVFTSSVAWGDYDNDGDPDILLTGQSSSLGRITKIFRNDGNTFADQTGIVLPGLSDASVAWGDYDADGDLDILLSGYSSSGTGIVKIFRNNGDNTFTDQTGLSFLGMYYSSARWGDCDNDGDLDILVAGRSAGSINITKIYLNNGSTFSELARFNIPGLHNVSAEWGDYDNDQDLDIAISGETNNYTRITNIYRNKISVPNNNPAAPTGLTAVVDAELELKWNPVTTDETPGNGLTYNVRIGTTSGASNISATMSAANGLRRLPAMGNAQTGTSFKIRNLPRGTYYWSVQAIDNNYQGGTFAAEQTFVYNFESPANNMSMSNIGAKSLKASWIRGNGSKCIVFAKENGSGTATPVNNTTYTGNKAFGSGTEITSTGWYCVYNGNLDTATITGLKPLTNYAFHVIEYEGAPGAEQYFTASSPSGQIIQSTSLFTEQSGISLPGVYDAAVNWGDYDKDGDLDILLSGATNTSSLTKVYRNNGDNTFTEQTGISLLGVSSGSAEWGDYDNDGDVDILLAGFYSNTVIAKVYRNNGDGTFTDQPTVNLTQVDQSSADWGDYDNDGDLDLLLTGSSSNGRQSKIFRNNSDNTFTEDTGIALLAVSSGSSAWGDYDNDGDLDILHTGNTSGRIARIYRNNGDRTFTQQSNISITGVENSSVAWGDYNNDGFVDFVITGGTGTGSVSKIYRNNGDNTFSEQTGIVLPGIGAGSAKWGDYDNDGDLDLLLSGHTGSTVITKIFRNDGTNSFSEQSNIVLPGMAGCSVVFGDYDNDGDLDILMAGNAGASFISRVFKNEIITPNTAPAAPNGLTHTLGYDVKLQWNTITTDATPEKGITYNVRVGTTSGASNVLSAMATSNGERLVVAPGNANQNTFYTLKGLPRGTYYWSVQAIDNNFEGGAFATEQTLVNNFEGQARELKVIANTTTSVKCSWIRGNGDKCIVFAAENGTGNAVPLNNTTYTGNKAFGSGTQIGTTGWYCVYNGGLDTATITGLKQNTEYRFHVIEYAGNAGAESYFSTTGTANPTQYVPAFTEQTQIALPGVSGSTQAWGDYDSDGDLDLILGGYTGSANVVELHKNNGDNTFTKTSVTFDVNSVYDILWFDYDNDGDLDIFIASSFESKIFQNNGDGTFPVKVKLPNILGKCSIADFDNDGYKDIVSSGMGGTKFFKNNHDETFTIQTTDLPTASNSGSVATGDYDNDGDMDVILAGLYSSSAFTKVFKNDGNFVFTEQTGIVLPGLSNCDVQWADMDNDGDLDIVLSGADYDLYTKVYDNNGNNTFTDISGSTFKSLYRSTIGIGDYDNDGLRDILVSGSVNGDNCFSYVYRNNGSKVFTQSATVAFTGIQYGTTAWGDYDNDGDLDLFLCGITEMGRVSKVFRNNLNTVNAPPSATLGLYATLIKNDVKFTWSKTVDDKTASNGLSYNLYLYETSKTGYQLSPSAFSQSHTSNGLRLVASQGDIRYGANGYTIKGIPAGTYKWSIQAVDAGFKGGAFSSEGLLTILDLTNPAINVAAQQITGTTSEMQYSKTSTDGTNGTWVNCSPSNTSLYCGTGGFDVWIRQVGNLSNNRKIGTVAPQASAPEYGIDFDNETTDRVIPVTDEYSTYQSMAGSVSGTGVAIPVPIGQIIYIRTKATASSVASAIRSINVAGRFNPPSYRCDYMTEKTMETIPANVEYSTTADMSNAVSGTGVVLNLVPGQNLYFRAKADVVNKFYKSGIYTLTVKSRPAVPTFAVDFNNEVITPTLSSTYEYSGNEDMSNALTGNLTKVSVIPGSSLYIRAKATPTSFKSEIQQIWTMSRPNTTEFTIDYVGETTTQSLSAAYEYSSNENMSNAVIGSGQKAPVVPGQKLYLRIKATDHSFKSGTFTLTAPDRPAVPAYTIDYLAETTAENVPAAHEYSANQDMSNSSVGTESKVAITPGQNMYFRTKATSSAFKSNIQSLIVPPRPGATINLIVDDGINSFDWTFVTGFNNISDYEYSVNNGTTWINCTQKPTDIGAVNIAVGTLKLRVKGSATRFSGTAANSVSAFTTSISSLTDAGINMFPNPVEDVINLSNLKEKSWIYIYNMNGKLVKQEYFEQQNIQLPVSDLTPGIYLIKIKSTAGEFQSRFTKL